MKKIVCMIVAACCYSLSGLACTNFIVGKKASADGSVMCTYNADSYGMFTGLCHYPAGTHAKGEMRKIIDYDTYVCHGEIPEAPVTYNVIGNINEYQVSIGETTFGGREELVDSTGMIDYGSLMYLGLQRAKTAREAIDVMTSLVDKYGYNSEGETFTICDPNEAWIMEMIGKGPGRTGAVWVAIRIPDDAICAHANQSRITTFDQKDKKNVLYSKDVIKFAREKGFFSGKDKDFSFNAAYAYPDFGGRRYCEARVWSFFNHFSKDMDRYLPYAMGKVKEAEPMPLWIIPNKKVSLQDVQACMRDHYEGTPFSLDSAIGGGVWQMPYRPTPLSFKVDGKERPTSTQQTGFSYVAQLRGWLPRQIGGILWFGNDDGNMVAYTPVYCSAVRQPECYNTPGADAVTFSDKNAFWVCNWVSNMVYPRYSAMFPALQAVRDSLEQSYFKEVPAVDLKAQQLLASSEKQAIDYLTAYTCQKGDEMISRWRQLAIYLIVKFNDMAEKKEVNGRFETTPEGVSKVARPGYPEATARKLVEQTGDRYAMPDWK